MYIYIYIVSSCDEMNASLEEGIATMEFKEPLLVCKVRAKKRKKRDICKYRYLEMKTKLGTCILRVLYTELRNL